MAATDLKKVTLPDGVTYDLIDDTATHIQAITTAQWETLTPEQKASGDYVITDATMVPLTASAIPYSNTSSGLTADDVQEAIDELAQGGGGGGTTNYNNLTNKPQINSVTLSGDKSSSDLNIVWQGTQAQYDALVLADTIDPNTVYYVTDGTTVACASNEVTYDHTVSGLSATDVKGALDELADEKMDKANPTGTGKLSINRKANTSEGDCSVAVGYNCTASGSYSHAEGVNTISSSGATHAEGSSTKASGSFSHAEGYGTEANHRSQHVFGENNIPDNSGQSNIYRGNYVEIVGNGVNSTSQSNARTLDWSGNEMLAGDLKINGNVSVGTMIKTIPSARQYVVSSGTLNANSFGYVTVSVDIPSGYKTTGLTSIYLGHPSAAGGLQLCGGISQNQTGTITIYLSYFTPVAIASGNTDFFVNVGIINSNVNIN